MEEVDPEHEALRLEIDTLKEKIITKQAAVKDKSLFEICSAVGAAPRVKLSTKRILRGHIHKVNAIDFAADNRHLVSGSLDGKLIIWDTWNGSKVQIIPLKSSWVLAVDYAASGLFIGESA